ncbi:tetratricopeptide repeat protein, partial [Streptomyces sp. 8N706]
EEILREAVAETPAGEPLADRLNLLLGRALALRFRRLGHLPDLYEGGHVLEQAARRAREGQVRAEAWLELGAVRVALHRASRAARLSDAAAAYRAAADEARRTAGEGTASVPVARALHGRGTVLELMDRPGDALDDYRAASREWLRLADGLADVPWDEMEATRVRIAELEAD